MLHNFDCELVEVRVLDLVEVANLEDGLLGQLLRQLQVVIEQRADQALAKQWGRLSFPKQLSRERNQAVLDKCF